MIFYQQIEGHFLHKFPSLLHYWTIHSYKTNAYSAVVFAGSALVGPVD